MTYTVLKIEEDIDFGCEERASGPMAVVTLESEAGEASTLKFLDKALYDEKIEVGDRVYIDENGNLQKALDEDWTKSCNTSMPGM